MSAFWKIVTAVAFLATTGCGSTPGPDVSETVSPPPIEAEMKHPEERIEERSTEREDPRSLEYHEWRILEDYNREEGRRAAAQERDRELNERPLPPPDPENPAQDPAEPPPK